MNVSYGGLCSHSSVRRINNNFIMCNQCGETIVNQLKAPVNKNIKDFTRENRSFMKKQDNVPQTRKMLEYYTDHHGLNHIVIDRSSTTRYSPHKYRVNINGVESWLSNDDIRELLAQSSAMRVDKTAFNYSRKN